MRIMRRTYDMGEARWGGHDAFTYDRYRLLVKILNAAGTNGKAVLDLGAGAFPVSSVVNCRLRITLDRVPQYRPTTVCNLANGIPLRDHSVDIVIAAEILEHIVQSRLFLSEIKRVLAPRGQVFLSVPNIVSLKYRLSFLVGRIPSHAAKADYTYAHSAPTTSWGHVRDYSFGELHHVLANNGFRIVSEFTTGVYWRGRRIVPPWMLPMTWGDGIIVQAVI